MTVEQLQKRLQKLTEKGYGKYELVAFEKGSVYNWPINNVYLDTYDIKHEIKRITLGR